MKNKIIHLNDENFETNILQRQGPFLVDFWAEWCSPCKRIAPILEEIADEFYNKLTIAKLEVDKNPATAPKYGIRSIPTLLLFRNGKVLNSEVGVISKRQLRDFLNANL